MRLKVVIDDEEVLNFTDVNYFSVIDMKGEKFFYFINGYGPGRKEFVYPFYSISELNIDK